MASPIFSVFPLNSGHKPKIYGYCVIYIVIFTCFLTFCLCDIMCNGVVCRNGTCKKNDKNTTECECIDGWSGSSCTHCSGRVRISGKEGIITDGSGNYSEDNKCMWLVEPDPPNQPIRFKANHFATECGWDHLYIFDGDSVFAPLIAAYSGLSVGLDDVNRSLPDVVAYSGSAYVYFYSDAAYNMTGFDIKYEVGHCPGNCSGHGVCQNSSCVCDNDHMGERCEIKRCPNNCSGNGYCADGLCSCNNRYKGRDCSISVDEESWQTLDVLESPTGRMSSASVVIGDYLWVAGGYSFGNKADFLIKFNLKTRLWQPVTVTSTENPDYLYGHVLGLYRDCLYIHGGVSGQHIESRLWIFNLTTSAWTYHDYNDTFALAGHSAVVLDNTMYIIFGHSPLYGYLNRVHELHLDHPNYTFVSPPTKGALVKGSYGQTSVYYEKTQEIYVYGGYQSGSISQYSLTDKLYSYNPRERIWTVLAVSGSPRYLHTAVMLDDLMLVFGGNTHNDTQISLGAKCYSPNFLAYNPECNSWHSLSSAKVPVSSARYGHVAQIYKNAGKSMMYMFGGFTGVMLNDVIEYVPGVCTIYSNRTSCLSAFPGRECVWSDEEMCIGRDEAKFKKDIGVINSFERGQNCTPARGADKFCKNMKTCGSCLSTAYDCKWCSNNCSATCSSSDQITLTNITKCPRKYSVVCDLINNCQECRLYDDCEWKPKQGGCQIRDQHTFLDDTNPLGNKPKCDLPCYKYNSCENCTSKNCMWCGSQQRCVETNSYVAAFLYGQCKEWTTTSSKCADDTNPLGNKPKCDLPCYKYNSCENCTSKNCMWCGSQQRCVETNSYVAAFLYGQCKEWTTTSSKCAATRCSDLYTCKDCSSHPACGWCNDPSNTGLGKCVEGSASGPMKLNKTTGEYTLDTGMCKAERWHFIKCPPCQCNGHSSCTNQTNVCDKCQNLTKGDHCDTCMDGYWGNPKNGGNCTACNCNGQAEKCNHVNGDCYCRTRGVKGPRCDECDTSNNYFGNPNNGGTCYYDLKTDYQFTFNLSKREDDHYTGINFMNIPSSPDRDVDFTVNCSGTAYLNVTFRSTSNPTEQFKVREYMCTYFRAKFEHKEYNFGRDENVTFLVYVYGFKTPFWLQISFSQFPKIDLVHFFVTFFSCFLSLLIIAAVLYKIKHKYDGYRRRQRMIVEMEEMASRPSAAITLEIEKKYDNCMAEKKDNNLELRKRKRNTNKPTQMALEPLHNQKAAVVSLFVQLPGGDEDFTPSGTSGLAIGSALISIGHQRKQSSDHGKSDKQKHKKHLATPDTCV